MENRQMPRYRSHKEVFAFKIRAIEIHQNGAATITPAETGYSPFTTWAGYSERWKPSGGDMGYYIRYGDGYEGWSPTYSFEAGYTRIE
jgi:hypothetical protein